MILLTFVLLQFFTSNFKLSCDRVPHSKI